MTRRFLFGLASAAAAASGAEDKPALLGGRPVREAPFFDWPVIEANDEKRLVATLRSGEWYRRGGRRVAEFEQRWAATLGVRHALATNGGTTALFSALAAFDVGPKDEVIVPPYTFIATVNVVLLHHALPVFVDTDPETHQIDARRIEAAITPNTRAILPVHIGGAAADMDAILKLARRRDLAVVEDACQAHLGEWRGRKLGALGDVGCFSFQASKNLNCGEGGCLTTDREDVVARASAFHNNGGAIHGDAVGGPRERHGCNLRMTEFQGAVLLAQMERIEEQAERRTRNAAYLDELLSDIPGVTPARSYGGCTRNAYHLYMLRYDPDAFAGLPKRRLIEALRAEGAPISGGYGPLNHDSFLENAFASRAFRAIYSPEEIARWRERNQTPANDRLCQTALWLGQTTLLAGRDDMEQIAAAFRKVQRHAAALKA